MLDSPESPLAISGQLHGPSDLPTEPSHEEEHNSNGVNQNI